MPTFKDTIALIEERIKWTRKWTDHIPNSLHSIRVYQSLKRFWFSETVQMGWLLHDIVEDGETSFEELKRIGYSAEVIHLVDLSSHDMNSHEGFHRRENMLNRLIAEENKDAWAIKIADISDNLLECHHMPNKVNLGAFLNKKCPVFIYYGNKYFAWTQLYNEFIERYFNQVRTYNDYFEEKK